MLWRALRHIDHGFYIDVGAAWPDQDSVTKAFYERGWRGINIEPNTGLHQQFIHRRPEDINLCVALGEREDRLTMSILGKTGLSTLAKDLADQYQNSGLSCESLEVTVSTLAAIWKTHIPKNQQVHFLKVDVEGFENEVLRGNDWSENRPWIVVAEAVLPLSRKESYNAWEPNLLNAGYLFAYADGLNRFYVATEKQTLLKAFSYPPNAFDEFVRATEHECACKLARAEALAIRMKLRVRLAELKALRTEPVTRCNVAQATTTPLSTAETISRLQTAEARVAALTSSTSWRITTPLRWVGDMARAFMKGKAWMRRPFLKTCPDKIVTAGNALSPRALRVYRDLKDSMSNAETALADGANNDGINS